MVNCPVLIQGAISPAGLAWVCTPGGTIMSYLQPRKHNFKQKCHNYCRNQGV